MSSNDKNYIISIATVYWHVFKNQKKIIFRSIIFNLISYLIFFLLFLN
jgi:hypothetical protein